MNPPKKLSSLFLLVVISGSLVMSVMADVLTLTVNPGRPAVAAGRVNNNDHRYYEVQLNRKYSMLIQVEGAVTFDIVSRQGKALATGVTNWEDAVPADGWYDIIVKTDGGNQAFKLTLTAYQTQQPTPATPARATPSKNDVSGFYFPAGDLPEDFYEIEHLTLATFDDQGNPAPLNGLLRPRERSARDYKLTNIRLNGNEISFSTTRVGKVSYSFKGRFETMGNFPENPPPSDRIVLKGELRKYIDGGAPLAGTNVSFTYSAGD